MEAVVTAEVRVVVGIVMVVRVAVWGRRGACSAVAALAARAAASAASRSSRDASLSSGSIPA